MLDLGPAIMARGEGREGGEGRILGPNGSESIGFCKAAGIQERRGQV